MISQGVSRLTEAQQGLSLNMAVISCSGLRCSASAANLGLQKGMHEARPVALRPARRANGSCSASVRQEHQSRRIAHVKLDFGRASDLDPPKTYVIALPTATVKSIDPDAFIDQAASSYVIAVRV
jgi:hypothetical protein